MTNNANPKILNTPLQKKKRKLIILFKNLRQPLPFKLHLYIYMRRSFTLFILFVLSSSVTAQSHKVFGKIINTRLEPLAFVSVEVKQIKIGTITHEDGIYQLELDEGKYDLVVSIIGYQPQVVTVIMGKYDVEKNIILENDNSKGLAEVVIKGKDRADEIIRNVIRNKDNVIAAAGSYSCKIYIKAVQEDSSKKKQKKPQAKDSADTANADLKRMALAEVALNYDYESPQRTKEERPGLQKEERQMDYFIYPLLKVILIFITTW